MIPIEEYEEILKCSKSEEYFINKYIKPTKEFKITDRILEMNDKELVIGYLLHKVIFNSYNNVAIVNKNSKEFKKFLDDILHIYKNLPDIFKLNIKCLNKSEIIFENDSKIYLVLNSSYCLKGYTINFLVLNGIIDDKNIIEMIYPMMCCNKDSKIIKNIWQKLEGQKLEDLKRMK